MIDAQKIPVRSATPLTGLKRIFTTYRDGAPAAAWFFSNTNVGHPGRFDLPPPDGTCYFSNALEGCWLEVFHNTRAVDAADVDARSVATADSVGDVVLADLTAREARMAGVTLDHAGGDDYKSTQALAAAVHAIGHGGILGWLRHDPSAEYNNIAIFGAAGARRETENGWLTTVVPLADHAEHIADELGVAILPIPRDMKVTPPPKPGS